MSEQSVIVYGGSSEERRQILENQCTVYRGKGWTIHRYPELTKGMESFLKKTRSLIPEDFVAAGDPSNLDFLRDAHRDWIKSGKDSLFILAECDAFYRKARQEFDELLGDFLTAVYMNGGEGIGFAISLASDPSDLVDSAQLFVGRSPADDRSPKQLFQEYFKIIPVT